MVRLDGTCFYQPCSRDCSYVFQFLVSHTGSGVCPCDSVSSQLKGDVSITVCLKSCPGLLLCPRLVAWVEEKLGPRLAGLGLNIVSQCLAITLWGKTPCPSSQVDKCILGSHRSWTLQFSPRAPSWGPTWCLVPLVDRQHGAV